MKSTGLDVSGLKVGAIINTSSGGCDSESETEMLDILKSANVTNCKALEHELFVRSEILRERQSRRFYSAVTGRRGPKPNESFLQLKSD
jgi:hypothetical protein